MKRLIIGDIHGCYSELQDLIKKADLTSQDEIIALGDIVDRGPESPEVLSFFKNNSNAISLKGNHERKHVRSLMGLIKPALSQIITHDQIGDKNYKEACDFMNSLPHFIDLPEALLIHGFWEPGVSLSDQKEVVLLGVLTGEKYLDKNYSKPWYDLYDGDKPIIVGHRDYLKTGKPLILNNKVFCINTGCAKGRSLTGLILPDFKLISVPSSKNYWSVVKSSYYKLRLISTPNDSLSWDQAEELISLLKAKHDISKAEADRIKQLHLLRSDGETAINKFYSLITQENERILTHLNEHDKFIDLSPADQFKKYDVLIRNKSFKGFFHNARKGKLELSGLRNNFKGPKAAIEFISSLSLNDKH